MKKNDLHRQAYDRLKSYCVFGRNKSKDKKGEGIKNKIYSYKTFNNYWEHIKIFIDYVKKEHGECSLDDARQYTNEWLQYRENTNKSAWTVHEEAKALGKLYQISPNDIDYYKPPIRNKDDIKRSRNHDEDYKKRFNEEKYEDLVYFCKHTGLRRRCLTKIENDCLYSIDDIENEIKLLESQGETNGTKRRISALKDARLFKEKWFIEVKKGKGGKLRFAPILDDDMRVRDKITNTYLGNKVWPSKQVKNNCDVHGYRRMYAQSLYMKYARDVSTLTPYYYDENGKRHLSRYYRRGKNKGIAYDREMLVLVSVALGHGKDRATTVVDNYL